jgi:uncharacterized tellurite resistance protein B-like protein
MPILMTIIAALVGLSFWWWRLKVMSEAAGDVGDAAGRAWGKYKRFKFKQKVELSPVEAVKDPAAAAVVMMFAMIKEENAINEAAEAAVRKQVTEQMKISDPTELMVFGKWVASHVVDANSISQRYAKLWAGALNMDERAALVKMVRDAASEIAPLTRNQDVKLKRMRERLGLTN